jgi:hypothetical protein
VSELATVLSRGVDVNARNEHGMTALMRASRQGHSAMVRALLEHGADPNLARHDKFTALALAAFFGHTETVRILIEHGAKTEVVTRSGTSPRMWAVARTFTDAARCFEEPVPRTAPAPVPIRRAPAPAPTPVPVVKTLKDPPEIWDLVHEVPRGFDPKSAFLARATSLRRPVAVSAFAGLLFVISCGVAMFVFRSSPSSNVVNELPPVQTTVEVKAAPPAPVENSTAAAPVTIPADPLAAHVVQKSPAVRQPRQRAVVENNVAEVAPVREVPQVAVPEIEKPKPREVPVKPAPLSPHLITPAKSDAPKGKVIQWP